MDIIEAQHSAVPGRSAVAAVPIATPCLIQVSKCCMEGVLGAMRDLQDGVPMDGENKHDKYRYRRADDVVAAVQPVLVKNRINVHQREVARTIVQGVLCIHYHFDVSHGDGEMMVGVGAMTGMCRWEFKKGTVDDKAGSKAFVSALKYFLIGYFKIPTEDAVRTDPDDRGADEDIDDYDRRASRRNEGGDRDPPRRRADDRDETDRERARQNDDPRQNDDDRHGSSRPNDDAPPFDDRWAGPSDGPSDGPPGPSNPPSEDPPPEQPDLKTRVIKLKKFLETAVNEDGAFDIWHSHADLLRSIPRATYDYLREAYQSRWQIYPPILNPARNDE